jgi:hypothetical protein
MSEEWPRDGWDAATRIGVLTPHADVGPESELQAMAPVDVALHAVGADGEASMVFRLQGNRA